MPRRSENYKIKRYRSLYPNNTKAKSAMRVVLICVVIAALGAVGWIAYEPISQYLNKLTEQNPSSDASKMQTSEDTSTEESSSSQSEAPAGAKQNIVGVYVPPDVMENQEQLDAFLENLDTNQFTAVLFDVKNELGRILYASGQTQVQRMGAQTETAFDLRETVKKIKAKGMIPMARMHTFRDIYVPSRLKDSGVKYMNTEILWVDNAPEKGGKAWLNPYSTVAQAYLLSIAEEVASAGVEVLYFDSVMFPTGVGLQYASYGEVSKTKTRAQVLEEFMSLAQNRLEPFDCQLSMMVMGRGALGELDEVYGGNPLELWDNVLLNTAPASLLGTIATTDGTLPANPISAPYQAVDGLLRLLKPKLTDKQVTALVQAYTATGNIRDNIVYTETERQQQVKALTEHEISDYIYFDPNGKYE